LLPDEAVALLKKARLNAIARLISSPAFPRLPGELFTDYETFMERLFSYQARQWSCSLTGKGGMTLEEALLCESKAQRKVDDAFPEIFVEPLCKMVHMSQVCVTPIVSSYHHQSHLVERHPKSCPGADWSAGKGERKGNGGGG